MTPSVALRLDAYLQRKIRNEMANGTTSHTSNIARLRIQSGCGLVEKQQFGIAYERASHGKPLLLASG
jgi:hypothetical protein